MTVRSLVMPGGGPLLGELLPLLGHLLFQLYATLFDDGDYLGTVFVVRVELQHWIGCSSSTSCAFSGAACTAATSIV